MIVSLISLLIIVFTLAQLSVIPRVTLSSLIQFDAVHYEGIMEHGYRDESPAFFPLFPAMWRAVGGGGLTIAIFNLICYLVGSWALIREFEPSRWTILTFTTLPTLFFLFLPYSEATFYMGGCAMLIGANRSKWWIVLGALFWCTLARPAFTALLPAVLLMFAFGERPLWEKFKFGVLALITSGIGLFAVMAIQHHDTGSWFGFYEAQASYGNTIKFPELPLSSWGGGAVVKLDASALLFGLLCGVGILANVRRSIFRRVQPRLPLLLSLTYLFVVSMIALFLRNGELYSLNRFVYATPFAFVALHFYERSRFELTIGKWGVVFLVILIFTLLFGSFVHIRTFSLFAAASLFITMTLAASSTAQYARRYLLLLSWIIGLALQTFFLSRYLLGEWVA